MPKLRIRDDGTCYTYAQVPIEGVMKPRAFEIDHKGIKWLAKHDVSDDGQEMSRDYFRYLQSMGWAYIEGNRPKNPQVIVREMVSPATSPATGENVPSKVFRTLLVSESPAPTSAPAPARQPAANPPHWQRRTVKKAWFD